MGEFVETEIDGHVLTVTINRPERMNAVHPPANAELGAVFDMFEANDDLWVAIITGAGDRAFCAGNDLVYQAEGNPKWYPPMGFGGLTSRYERTKPVIAAGEDEAELRALGHDPNVHRQGQRQADAHGGAVDRRRAPRYHRHLRHAASDLCGVRVRRRRGGAAGQAAETGSPVIISLYKNAGSCYPNARGSCP